MIDILNAKQSDLEYVRQKPIERAVKEYPPLTVDGWAKTAVVDGDIIGVGGIVKYWNHVGEGWLILSEEANEHKVEMVRAIRLMMEQGIMELNLRRFQVTVRVNFSKAKNLVESLGFEREGTLKYYLPDGTDAYMYALIRKEI